MQARLEAPFGTVAVRVDERERVVDVDLVPREVPTKLPEGFPLDVARAVRAYLEGDRDELVGLPVGAVDVTEFQQRVLDGLAKVPAGRTVAYGELAERIGSPGAARAVGGALARNPVPLVRPCHRVVAADGLGGFGGCPPGSGGDKLAVKRWLLELEGAAVEA